MDKIAARKFAGGQRTPGIPPPPWRGKITIDPMQYCLHGRPCNELASYGDWPPMCNHSCEPIWELKACPLKKWKLGEFAEFSEEVRKKEEIPGCNHCKAASMYSNNKFPKRELFCFHAAVYLGKSKKPVPCRIAIKNCPKI